MIKMVYLQISWEILLKNTKSGFAGYFYFYRVFWGGGIFNDKFQRFWANKELLYLYAYGDIIDNNLEHIEHCYNNTHGPFQKENVDLFVNDVSSINYNEKDRVGA